MKATVLGAKRRRLKVTQEVLAKRVGVHYRCLKPIEDGVIGIDEETFIWLDRLIDEAAEAKSRENEVTAA